LFQSIVHIPIIHLFCVGVLSYNYIVWEECFIQFLYTDFFALFEFSDDDFFDMTYGSLLFKSKLCLWGEELNKAIFDYTSIE
jgi:hypothetical protein